MCQGSEREAKNDWNARMHESSHKLNILILPEFLKNFATFINDSFFFRRHSMDSTITAQHIPIHGDKIHQVRFAEMAELYLFDDYGPESRPNTWYTEWDFANFERNRINDLIVYKKSQKSRGRHGMNDHNATIRGLEYLLSRDANRLHKQRQDEVVEAVLETQTKLELECVTTDPSYAIAFASTSCTYSSKNEARERAYEDRIEVVNMQRDEEEAQQRQQKEEAEERKRRQMQRQEEKQETPLPNVVLTGSIEPKYYSESEQHVHGQNIAFQSSTYDSSIMSPKGPPTGKDCFNPLAGIALFFTPPPIFSDWRREFVYNAEITSLAQ